MSLLDVLFSGHCVTVDLAHVSPRLNLCGLRRYFICFSTCFSSCLSMLVGFLLLFLSSNRNIPILQWSRLRYLVFLLRFLEDNWRFCTLCVKCLLRLKFIPYIQLLLCVLQVFLCSVGHPNSSWSAQWIGPSSSITVILWALPRGKISKNTTARK